MNIKYGQIFGAYTVGGAAVALLHRRPGYRAACLRGNEEAYLSMYISSISLSTYTSIYMTLGGTAVALVHRRPGYGAARLCGNEEACFCMNISSIYVNSRWGCGCASARERRIRCCAFALE